MFFDQYERKESHDSNHMKTQYHSLSALNTKITTPQLDKFNENRITFQQNRETGKAKLWLFREPKNVPVNPA